MKRTLVLVLSIVALVSALFIGATATATAASPNPGPQTWQLDNDNEMERTGGLNDDGQTGSVVLASTASAMWLADEAAVYDVTFVSGAWVVELATDADWGTNGNACTIEVGEYDGTSFTAFSMALNSVLEWNEATRSYILRVEVQSGSETIYTGNWLAIKVYNKDRVSHTVYTGEFEDASCVRSPQTDPGYPLPEIAAGILLAGGIVGLVGFMAIRRKKTSTTI
jgi:hypothetical protein